MIPLRDSHPAGKFPFWTWLIIALNIYFFYLLLTSSNPDAFMATYALIPINVDLSNFATLIPFFTSQFLHGGFLHIISNMLFLHIFGDNVEARLGYLLFPIFYLFSGFIGGFAQYIFMPDSIIPMLGASGAVAGVLGAYFVYFPHHNIKTLIPFFGFFTVVDIPASIMLVYWFITQILAGTVSIGLPGDGGGIAYFAHIGGFSTGWIIAKIFRKFKV
ncbi:rhomboid family intramembrane serine protease [Candidatus Daviesbacteria bacterium]|nr:rhomboid family intramembrane serine protease [Candidatus Daviesbacteria bacterium]